MALLISFRQRRQAVRAGYLFCPKCYRRTPGEMFVVANAAYFLGFIPCGSVGGSVNFLACGRCGESFAEAGDWAFDFGDHPEPTLWDCRACGEQNTSERFRCRRCGKHI